jgi:multidrug efflux pump subunit AcrB
MRWSDIQFSPPSKALRQFAGAWLVFFLGQDFFPQVDAGLIRLHFRARPGLRVEETARLCDEVERVLRSEIPAEELQTMLDNIGVPYSGLNLSYSSSGVIGTSDAEILISLNAEHHHPTAQYVRRLRRELPSRFPGVEFFFQPADIVSQILNFGLPAPVDIQIMGADMIHFDNFGLGAASYDAFSKAQFRAFLEARGKPAAGQPSSRPSPRLLPPSTPFAT